MRFIHISDVHLGVTPDEGKPWSDRRKQDIWDSFAEIIEHAGTEGADFLFISGDLFHRQPLLKELKEVNYLFGRIPKTKVVLIAGNHDYVHPNSYYRTFQWESNVHFFPKEEIQVITFPSENVSVYGLSYWHREIREALYDQIQITDDKRINILLAHGGDAKHIPFQTETLAQKGFDYVACGHIHKGGYLSGSNMVMAGSLEPTEQNDIGQHGYWQGDVTKRGCSVKFYPIRKCEYIPFSVAVNSEMTNLGLQEKIAEILTYSEPFQIYKLILSGRKSPEMEFDLEQIMKMGHIVQVVDELVPDYDFERLKETYDHQMIGRYIRTLEEQEQDPVALKALYFGVDALCKSMR